MVDKEKTLEDGGYYKIPSKKLPKILKKEKAVLVIDDDWGVREVLTAVIEELGVKVYTANDVDDALTTLASKHSQIACVFIDLHLPKKNGFAIIEKMHEAGWDNETAIFVCSGVINQKVIDSAKKYSVDGYLTKPLDAEEVTELMTRLFDLTAA